MSRYVAGQRATDPAASVRTMLGWHSMWIADDVSAHDGDRISTWLDSSGTRSFTQATANYQPRLVTAKIGQRAAVSFYQSYMQHNLPAALSQPFSVYVVANGNSNNGYRIVSALTPGGLTRNILGIAGAGSPFMNLDQNLVHTAVHTTQVARSASIANGASSTLRYNGVDFTGNAGAGQLGSLGLGAELLSGTPVSFGEVNIGFVGIKAGAFTAQELGNLDAWASTYYGLATQPEVAQENWSWWTRPRAVYYRGKTYVSATGPNTDNTISIYNGRSRVPAKVRVGQSGGQIDDHNNGALFIEPGKPPLLMYMRHGTEQKLKWRKGSLPIEQDPNLTTLASASEQELVTTGGASYFGGHVLNGVIHGMFRDANNDWRWSYTKSTDWGGTFSTPARMLAHGYQFYTASKLRGSVLRFATGSHPVNGAPPDQNVYYGEIDLATGNIRKADGTVLGNVDGTNLPIQISALTLVATPATGRVKWVYDVSDAPEPEVSWGSFDAANIETTSMYHYSRLAGGAWATRDIINAGKRFSEPNAEPYLGGAQFPPDSPGGVVYVAREAAGTWYVERRTTGDLGVSWTRSVLAVSADSRLARAWPVESREGVAPFEVMMNQVTRFISFNNMESTVRPA